MRQISRYALCCAVVLILCQTLVGLGCLESAFAQSPSVNPSQDKNQGKKAKPQAEATKQKEEKEAQPKADRTTKASKPAEAEKPAKDEKAILSVPQISVDKLADLLAASCSDPKIQASQVLATFVTGIEQNLADPAAPEKQLAFRKSLVKAFTTNEGAIKLLGLKVIDCKDDSNCINQEYGKVIDALRSRPNATPGQNPAQSSAVAPGSLPAAKVPAIETTVQRLFGDYTATILAGLCILLLLVAIGLLLARSAGRENRPTASSRGTAKPPESKLLNKTLEASPTAEPDNKDAKQDERLMSFIGVAVKQLTAATASGGKELAEELRAQLATVHERLDRIASDARLAASMAVNSPAQAPDGGDVAPLVIDVLLRVEKDRLTAARDAFVTRNGDILDLLQGREEVNNEAFLRKDLGVDLPKSLHGWDRLQDFSKRTVEDLVRFYEVMNTLKLVSKVFEPEYVENQDKELQLKRYSTYSNFMINCNSTNAASILHSFKLEKWLREDFLAFAEAFMREYMGLEARGEEQGLAEAHAIVLKALDMAGLEPITLQIGRTRFNEREHRAKSTVSDSSMPPDTIAAIVRSGFRKKTGEVVQQPEVLVNRF